MKQETVETIIGFLIIAIAAVFLVFAMKTSKSQMGSKGYELTAQFQNVEGINEGSDIMLAGIKVGNVEKMILDKEAFEAILTLKIDSGVNLPIDSSAAVSSSGFLGGKFISIEPGSEENNFKAGDRIKYTQSSISLEGLIGKFLYSSGSSKTTESAAASATTQQPAAATLPASTSSTAPEFK